MSRQEFEMKIQCEVLSAILQHGFVDRRTQLLVLPAMTTPDLISEDSAFQFLNSHFKQIEESTVRDYIRANLERSAIEPLFELTVPAAILTEEEIKTIFSIGGWEEFYRRYPTSQGQISVSQVGFNLCKTQALACVGIQSQSLRGHGSFFFVEKEKEQWCVKKSAAAWIS